MGWEVVVVYECLEGDNRWSVEVKDTPINIVINVLNNYGLTVRHILNATCNK